MDKKIFVVLAFVLLAGAGCTTTGTLDTDVSADQNTQTEDITATQETGSEPQDDADLSGDMIDGTVDIDVDADADVDVSAVKSFTVTGGNFEFTPATMTVKKGDTVRVTFKNIEGFHDFKLDEFDVATKQIQGGAEEVVEFVADQAGSFEYYCSVGSHRAMGMKGTLTVTE